MGRKENRYKVIHRWYLTPFKLLKMSPDTVSWCWQCGTLQANFWHMWWSCEKVHFFWRQIYNEVQQITGIIFPFQPAILLLLCNFTGK